MDIEDFLNGVFNHLEHMASARMGIDALQPPADSVNIQRQHISYLTNAWSLFELLKEKYGSSFEDEVKRNLAALGHDGDNILRYVGELRNSVMHRGMDQTGSGVVIAGVVRVVAPAEVNDRSRKKSFRPHTSLLVDVIDHFVKAIKNSSSFYLEPDISSFCAADRDELLEGHRDRVSADPSIPEWVKEASIKTTTAEMLSEAVSFRAKRLRAYLQ